jgi:protein pelota
MPRRRKSQNFAVAFSSAFDPSASAVCLPMPADKLFRINNVAKRKKYADLVEGVREAGGEALLFSSMHVSGEQLNNLSGIAAVLRFPLPELEDQEIVEEV